MGNKVNLSNLISAYGKSNLSHKEIAEKVGISRELVTKHLNGTRQISKIEQLVAYANTFGVSTDYLLGLTEASTTDTKVRNVADYSRLDEWVLRKLHYMYEKKSNSQWNDNVTYIEYMNIILKGFLSDTSPLYENLRGYINKISSVCSWVEHYIEESNEALAITPDQYETATDFDESSASDLYESSRHAYDIVMTDFDLLEYNIFKVGNSLMELLQSNSDITDRFYTYEFDKYLRPSKEQCSISDLKKIVSEKHSEVEDLYRDIKETIEDNYFAMEEESEDNNNV